MISYPGEILKRFGRYEAVDDLGVAEQAHCWRAWDPFLERFVRVAELPDLDHEELHRTLPRLDYAVKTWTGGGSEADVLDFNPGTEANPPYFVLRSEDADGRHFDDDFADVDLGADESAAASAGDGGPIGLLRRLAARLGLTTNRGEA